MRYPTLVLALIVSTMTTAFLLGQLPEDRGQPTPVPPDQATATFHISNSYRWQQVLSEPLVRQPLMVSFDDNQRLWLVEYRQYPEPAGLKPQSRDVHWRIVYDRMPLPPGRGGIPGVDRISVHEDTDHDGTYDVHHVFLDNLNIATAVAPVPGGAWVLNPPYLTFYADKNGDLQADGEPEIHLEGFGLEDTHSVVNSLTLGPDGWLYAAQGSTVTSSVKRYGSADPPVKTLGQAIWRYHPSKRIYEVFAEGGGNAFGVAFDDRGDIFSGHNGGDTRGFHYVQGGYFRKGFSKHGGLSNPFAFGHLLPMKHEPIQRFTHAMFMLDSFWAATDDPPSMFAIDPLHGTLIHTQLTRAGSTYSTTDKEIAVKSDDKWFRPVAITQGPDGGIYVCDWYDFQVAHLYAHVGQLDKDRGRVYRMTPSTASSTTSLPEDSTVESLLEHLKQPIRWQRGLARRRIANHPMRNDWLPVVHQRLVHATGTDALELLWTSHACGWLPGTVLSDKDSPVFDERQMQSLFTHSSPDVRRWLIRLYGDGNVLPNQISPLFLALVKEEADTAVLAQIASTAKRLPSNQAMPLLQTLLCRDWDESDPNLPWLVWWAVESHCDSPDPVTKWIVNSGTIRERPWCQQFLFPKLVERWASDRSGRNLTATRSVFESIRAIQDYEARAQATKLSLESFERAFQNRSLKSVPMEIIDSIGRLGVASLPLELRREDPKAIREAIDFVRDTKQSDTPKGVLIQIASEMKLEAFLPVMLEIVRDEHTKDPLLQKTISALSAYESLEVGHALLSVWNRLSDGTKSVAGATLAKRESWTKLWIEKCRDASVSSSSLPLDAQRAMRWIDEPILQSELDKLYPAVASFSLASANAQSSRLAKWIDELEGDPYRGKKLYRQHCGRCHSLFDEGGSIGPDLTGYQRDQLDTLLRNIVAPSLEIREGYQTVSIAVDGGGVYSGFVESETDDQVVLRGVDGQSTSIAKSDIESRKSQAMSVMPEGILDQLTPQEVSDLMAYLRSTQPLLDK